MFIKKCVRSFIEVRKLCLCMFPLVFVWKYKSTRASPSDGLMLYPGHSSYGGGLTPLQKCSWCILLPLTTGPFIWGVLRLWRDALDVFYSPSWLGLSLRESYALEEMHSTYSTAPADWATLWESLTPLKRCSRRILQPQPIGPLIERVLRLCRDAVGVFYSPSRLGHLLGESYAFVEMQSVYCTTQAD